MTADLVTSPTPYQLLPPLSPEEYDALRADIAENGIRVPLDVDEDGAILDGHHRSWIAADLGVDCPRRVVMGLTDQQKRDHARSVNALRRHLTADQRREQVVQMRTEGLTQTEIARTLGVDQTTVSQDLEDVREIPNVDLPETITDTLGRQQPARKPRSEPKQPKPRTNRKPLPDAFQGAAYDLGKVIQRLTNLAEDDRFPRNAEQVAAKHRNDLLRAADALAGVIQRLPSNTQEDTP